MRPHSARTLQTHNLKKTDAIFTLCRSRLITSPDRRMNVDQIRKHPFFYGVDWNSIRNIEAPFVPRLRSITDTSYFPTDELDQVPDEPVGGDITGAHKDLAFLGFVSPFTLIFTVYLTRNRSGGALFFFATAIPSRGSRFLQMLSDPPTNQNSTHFLTESYTMGDLLPGRTRETIQSTSFFYCLPFYDTRCETPRVTGSVHLDPSS